MISLKRTFLLPVLAIAMTAVGCGSEESSNDPESAILKMAQSDPAMEQFTVRPGLNSDIGFDTTKIDDYRLISRQDYPDGGIKQLTIGLDKEDKAPALIIRWDEEGNRTDEVETYKLKRNGHFYKWYPNGNLSLIAYFDNGKKTDTSMQFWENGFYKQKVTYKDGIKNGLWEQYSENGIKLKQGMYVNDSLNGPYTAWNQSGRLEYTGFYKNDKMSGEWKKYYPSGRLKAVTNYEDGERHGMYIVWDETGFPMAEDFYVHGEQRERPDSIPRAQPIDPPQIINPYGDSSGQ